MLSTLVQWYQNKENKVHRGEMMTISFTCDATSGTKSKRPVSEKLKQICKLPFFRLGIEVAMLVTPKDTLKSEKMGAIIM